MTIFKQKIKRMEDIRDQQYLITLKAIQNAISSKFKLSLKGASTDEFDDIFLDLDAALFEIKQLHKEAMEDITAYENPTKSKEIG